MANVRQAPGGAFVVETGARQAQLPDGTFIYETTSGSVDTTVTGNVGNATSAGASVTVYQGSTIQASVGAATGDGNNGTVTTAGLTTITAVVGNAAAAGAAAAVYQGVSILAFAGDATATGNNGTVTNNSLTTVSGLVGNVAAAGATASVANVASGSFVTDYITNDTGTPLALQPVVWTWFPAGRFGSMALVTALDGAGTTGADGKLTATGIPPGPGILMVAVRDITIALDAVYCETGTVA